MSRRGVTFVEMLVVLPILFVLFGGILLVLTEAGRGNYLFTDAQIAVQTDTQRMVDRLSEDLRRATSAALVQCVVGSIVSIPTLDGQVSYAFNAAPAPGARTLSRTDVNGTLIVGSSLESFSCQGPTTEGVMTLTVTSRATTLDRRVVPQRIRTDVRIPVP